MLKQIAKIIKAFLPKKLWLRKIYAALTRDRFAELESLTLNRLAELEAKIETVSRNVDWGNGQLVQANRNIDFANQHILCSEGVLRFLEGATRATIIDVANIHISQGWTRKIHRAGGKMLELIDIICHEYEFPYFLYAGSLIGAKLYGHAIPWDDDWDIGMLRQDYEKFRALCEDLFVDCDFKPAFIGFSIQMQYRDTFVRGDIFPFDQYYKDIDNMQEDLSELETKIMQAKENCPWKLWHWEEALYGERSAKVRDQADYDRTRQVYRDFVLNGREPAADGVLMENPVNKGTFLNGVHMYSTSIRNIFRYNWVFPLKRINYEGIEVNAPNDTDAILAKKYGDIYDWPQLIENHSLVRETTKSMMQDIEELLEMDMHTVYRNLKKNMDMRIAVTF